MLKSFSFNNYNITDKELSLFEYLVEHPDYKCDVAYDILINALEGRIDYTRDFNLRAYEAKIKSNRLINVYNKSKIEKTYDAPISDDSDDSIAEFIQEPRDCINELIDKELYNEALNFILSNNYYLVNTEEYLALDLKLCLANALIGIPDAIKYIKLACDTDSKLKDYIEVLLTYGIDDSIKEKLRG